MGSITVGGIGFSWTGTYTTGQFVDGPYWLHLPSGTVSVNEPTPAQTTSNGQLINGAELNPESMNERQGYNGHNTNVFDAGLAQTSWPISMSAGDILVKARGRTDVTGPDRAGCDIEHAALYIVDTVPHSEAFSPACVGFTNRPTPTPWRIDTGQWADIDAAVASLPTYSVSSFSGEVPTFSDVFTNGIDKFAFGYGQCRGTPSTGGYQQILPNGFVNSLSTNYGRETVNMIGAAALLLISDAITALQKKSLLIRLLQHGCQWYEPHKGRVQNGGNPVGGNGAHHQFGYIPMLLYLHFSGQNVNDLYTYHPGHQLGQVWAPTQNDIDMILQPHSNAGASWPMSSTIRTIASVSGNTLTINASGNDGETAWMDGVDIVRVSDGARAYSRNPGSSYQALLDAQPSPAFQTGQQVVIEPHGGWSVDRAEWLIQKSDRTNRLDTLALGKSVPYRTLQRWSESVLLTKALGLSPTNFDACDQYVARCVDESDYPPGADYDTHFQQAIGGKNFAENFWNTHYSSMTGSPPALPVLPSGSVSATVTVP